MEWGAAPVLAAGMVALAAGGMPHCAAMCGLPCAPWIGNRSGAVAGAFLGARMLGYTVAGAALAGGAANLAEAAAASRLAQPLWLAWHLLALGWGLMMLVRGEQPTFRFALAQPGLPGALANGWQPVRPPGGPSIRPAWPALVAGLAWVAWPCGLLQSALLLASLADGAAGGAALMAMFAAVTSAGLWFAPALWRRWARHQRQMARFAGAVLMACAVWGLAQQSGIVAWCLSRM